MPPFHLYQEQCKDVKKSIEFTKKVKEDGGKNKKGDKKERVYRLYEFSITLDITRRRNENEKENKTRSDIHLFHNVNGM